jgi:hypothetical protein
VYVVYNDDLHSSLHTYHSSKLLSPTSSTGTTNGNTGNNGGPTTCVEFSYGQPLSAEDLHIIKRLTFLRCRYVCFLHLTRGLRLIQANFLRSNTASTSNSSPTIPSLGPSAVQLPQSSVLSSISISSIAPLTSGATGLPSNSALPTDNPSKTTHPVGAIVGAVLGVLCVLVLCTLVLLWLRRRKCDQMDASNHSNQISSFMQDLAAPAAMVGTPELEQPPSVHSPARRAQPSPGATPLPASHSRSDSASTSAAGPSTSHISQLPSLYTPESFPSPTTMSISEQQAKLRKHADAVFVRLASLQREDSSAAITSMKEAREEIARLRAENMRLTELQQSDWARGLTDEPPPSYFDITRSASTSGKIKGG